MKKKTKKEIRDLACLAIKEVREIHGLTAEEVKRVFMIGYLISKELSNDNVQ